VIDPSAEEGLPKGAAKQRKLDERLEAARRKRDPQVSATATAPADGVAFGPPAVPVPATPPAVEVSAADEVLPAPEVAEDVADDVAAELAADAIVIDAVPRHVADPVAPVATADVDGWDAGGGIEIDVVSRNATAPPPIEYEGSFDPDGLVIDPPR
jgi:hypothetical protein